MRRMLQYKLLNFSLPINLSFQQKSLFINKKVEEKSRSFIPSFRQAYQITHLKPNSTTIQEQVHAHQLQLHCATTS
jgi:hypothetical protein